MKQIESFTVDHMKLDRGVYVSRKDEIEGKIITTFDIRMTRPNFEPVINTAEIHTIEHLGATFLRNHREYGKKVVYFGPMGCRTGFYLILAGDFKSEDIIDLLVELFEFMKDFSGEVPGAKPECCGNYKDMNLEMAKYISKKYLEEVLINITQDKMNYSV